MKAVRLFEWHELDWMPKLFRHGVTDYLRAMFVHYEMYSPIVPLLADLIHRTGHMKIFDFCSGSGGMLAELQQLLFDEHHLSVDIELSDKFPNATSLKPNTKLPISYHPQSIDILKYKEATGAIRTLFTSFHHFKPREARQILQCAVDSGDPIAVFEFTENKASRYLLDVVIPLSVLQLALKIKPKSWRRLFFIYCIPLLSLITCWDGMVSNLRTYSQKQLERLVDELAENTYQWSIGKIPAGLKNYNITYLIGTPRQAKPC